MEAVRRKVEACDRVQNVFMVHSTGGGTGAGFGSRMVESIRDAYPGVYITSAIVTPFESGEAPLQHYNTILTAAKLQTCSDAVIQTSNDELMQAAMALRMSSSHEGAASGSAGARVSTDEMNSTLAARLAGVLFPVCPPKRDVVVSKVARHNMEGFDGGSFVSTTCPVPSMKVVQLQLAICAECRGPADTTATLRVHSF